MIGCPEIEKEKTEKKKGGKEEQNRTERISIGIPEKIENGKIGGAYILNIFGLRTFAFSFASASFAISFASICIMIYVVNRTFSDEMKKKMKARKR